MACPERSATRSLNGGYGRYRSLSKKGAANAGSASENESAIRGGAPGGISDFEAQCIRRWEKHSRPPGLFLFVFCRHQGQHRGVIAIRCTRILTHRVSQCIDTQGVTVH